MKGHAARMGGFRGVWWVGGCACGCRCGMDLGLAVGEILRTVLGGELRYSWFLDTVSSACGELHLWRAYLFSAARTCYCFQCHDIESSVWLCDTS